MKTAEDKRTRRNRYLVRNDDFLIESDDLDLKFPQRPLRFSFRYFDGSTYTAVP
jgi:hypothetical protein